MATFAYMPDWGATLKMTPRVRRVAFGDGYEQRAADGINNNLQTWDLTFSRRTDTEVEAILAFLNLMAGVTSFGWEPPSGGYVAGGYHLVDYVTGKKFVCRDWVRTFDAYNSSSIKATFIEVMA